MFGGSLQQQPIYDYLALLQRVDSSDVCPLYLVNLAMDPAPPMTISVSLNPVGALDCLTYNIALVLCLVG